MSQQYQSEDFSRSELFIKKLADSLQELNSWPEWKRKSLGFLLPEEESQPQHKPIS